MPSDSGPPGAGGQGVLLFGAAGSDVQSINV
jgi:hypothetical protein